MERYSIRRDVKRFVVEALCLLMVLYGAPLQALQAAASPVAEAASSEAVVTNVDEAGFLATAAEAISSTVAGGVEKAETFAGQPWMDALSILLAMGAGEETPGAPGYLTDAVPPLPPGFSESSGRGPSAVSRAAAGRSVGIPGAPASTEALLASKSHLDAIPLLGGWNLLSIPEEPTDPDPATVLAPIAGSFSQVFAFDACDPADPWKLYDPADAAASDLLELDPTKGFWIDATTAASLPSDGTLAPTTSWQLCTGWNLIGYPAGEPRHIWNALQSIEGKYIRAFGFDLADPGDPWEIWDAGAPDWANDLTFLRPGFGYWILVTEDVTLTIANQADAPTVEITSPADLAEITAPTTIRGIVQSKILESWTLTYRPVGEGPWLELGTGNFPVDDAPLATFDPTLLLNGMYEIRLEAVDIAGMAVEQTIAVVVDGQMKVGNFRLEFTDLRLPLSGLDIEVVRVYDSRDKRHGDFGFGWTLRLKQGLYLNNRTPGDGWTVNGGALPCQSAQETETHLTAIRISDQEQYLFRPRVVDLAPSLGGCFGRIVYDFVDGATLGASLTLPGNDEVFWENSGNRLIDIDTLEVFEPEDVRLTTRDGRIFDLDLELGVTRLEAPNGRSITIAPTGITHSSGTSVDFVRDAEGRITSIVDPDGGELTYGYDAAGDLVSSTDPVGGQTTYTYGPNHYLEDLFNPLGVRTVRTEYDDDGRMVRMIDSDGRPVVFEHDLTGRQEIIRDRLGFFQLLEYDDRGNIVREVDELGAVRLNAYDSRDNLVSHTDPLERETRFTYDAQDDLVEIVDPAGHKLQLQYNAMGEPTRIEDPLGQVTSIQYTAAGLPEQVTGPTGGVTSFTYGPDGEVATLSDALGRVTTFEADAAGNPTREVDALGNATTFGYDGRGNLVRETVTRTLPGGGQEILETLHAYDAAGRRTSTTTPDGSVTRIDYDALGRKSAFTDQLGRITRFDYDSRGALAAIDYPDGTREAWTYDVEGRLTAATDRAGRVTRMTYDPTGRPTAIELADGTFQRVTYDAAGQRTSITNRLGEVTSFVYDAAGREIEIRDALGQKTALAYDPLGRVTQVTDAKGQSTTYAYDAAGRWTSSTFADGSVQSAAYDALGQVIEETDLAGRTRTFAYDSLSRLTELTDPLGQATRFAYDEVGNLVSFTDAAGRVTRFEHDALGRTTARILPDGSRETSTYRADGTPASHTDFNGSTTTYAYDTAGRPILRQLGDGSTIETTYTDSGRRASDRTPLGTTTYRYDSRDRLVEKVGPGGDSLQYAYDGMDNLVEQIASVGGLSLTTGYGYDAIDQLVQVTDDDGGTTLLTYDANGNLESLTHPNGVVSSMTYDPLDRVTGMTVQDSSGAVLQQLAVTLDSAGLWERVEEHDGTVRNYTYDDLDRLLSEEVLDPSGSLVERRAYTYDAVGNRLSQTITRADGSVETLAATYDARDRLVSENGTPLTWDANGNLLQDGSGTSYSWDPENRLARVTLADGTIARFSYDADGNRVGTEVESTDGSVESTGFLVDTNDVVSRVVAETDTSGGLTAHYTRAGQMLSMSRPGSGRAYYHNEPLGSVRLLTDSTGAPTDRYAYTAFGLPLSTTGSTVNPYRFAGARQEATSGLYDLRARWMDPGQGRFLSMDPFAGSPLVPVSLHRYLYANANPVRFVDPTGLFSVAGAAIAGAVIGIVSTIAVNFVLGRQTTILDIVKAGVAGAILGPLSLAYPLAGAGLAVFGVFSSLGLTASVLTDPNASAGQKVGAIAILIASLVGARAGLKYYRSSVRPGGPAPPGPPPATKPAPRPAPKPKPTPPSAGTEWANLVSPKRAHHILYGESPTSGGHMYPGNPGKSIFPRDWGPSKILHYISDLATDPKLTWTQQTGPKGSWYTKAGNPARFIVEGIREGIKIRVVLEPAGEGIITGFPI